MDEVFIISAVRTPVGIGKPHGILNPISPVDLSAKILQEVIFRAGVAPDQIEDIIWGCVTQIGGQGANLARLAGLHAGFPPEVPAVTLNRMCGSSQQAVHFAAQAIIAGDMDLIIAGGTEMMSHQPLGSDYPEKWPDNFPYPLVHQGVSAELMAKKWSLEREELDDFAFESHLRAMAAINKGYFREQILPIELPDGRLIDTDEGVRIPPDRMKMAALKPVFDPNGVITAGNSSQLSDGAAALLLASTSAVKKCHLTPIARIVARYVVGSDPVLMLDAPIPATKAVLNKAKMHLDDMDVIEVNEAFASVTLAWLHEFQVGTRDHINPNGGAIALGHPLGATGAVLMTKLLYELHRIHRRFGLQTMCIGHGMATATIVECL